MDRDVKSQDPDDKSSSTPPTNIADGALMRLFRMQLPMAPDPVDPDERFEELLGGPDWEEKMDAEIAAEEEQARRALDPDADAGDSRSSTT